MHRSLTSEGNVPEFVGMLGQQQISSQTDSEREKGPYRVHLLCAHYSSIKMLVPLAMLEVICNGDVTVKTVSVRDNFISHLGCCEQISFPRTGTPLLAYMIS